MKKYLIVIGYLVSFEIAQSLPIQSETQSIGGPSLPKKGLGPSNTDMITNLPGAQQGTQVVTHISSSTGDSSKFPNIQPGSNAYLKNSKLMPGFHSEQKVGVEATDMLISVPNPMTEPLTSNGNDISMRDTLENVGPMVSCRKKGGRKIGLLDRDHSAGLIIDDKIGNLNEIRTGTYQESVGEAVRLVALLTGLPNTAPGYPKELLQQKSGVL